MESTGVYWKPVYEAIERYHPNCQTLMVVNAHHMRNVPGKKTDIKDAEWIASLLRCGLLSPSFVPDKVTRNLREYTRLYKSFVWEKASYMNRLEKFLQMHGFKLSNVLSSIFTVSGRALLRILIDKGYLQLTDVRAALNKRVKKSAEEIHLAIKGQLNFIERRILKTLLNKVEQIETEIQEFILAIKEVSAVFHLEIEQLDSIPGIDVLSATAIIAEISGQPHKHFNSAEKLCSWAGVVPRNDESAGKIKSRKIMHGNSYIKSILCQASWAAIRVRQSSFSTWFWSHQGKLGKKKAIIAVARKILTLVYKLLKSGEFYDPNIALKAQSSPPLNNS